ncbi:MAG: S8 family serine peptidase [Bacteroidales bacterium]|jgi:hypothetical protein
MNRIILTISIIVGSLSVQSQSMYWIYFADKAGTVFNPYEYFDQKAIERRLSQGISLYDSTDFPLNTSYVCQVEHLSEEVIGETRWFNALAVQASPENIEQIALLPFVKEIVPIETYMLMTAVNETEYEILDAFLSDADDTVMEVHKQLRRMQGDFFVEAGIDGKGIRIAVFDAGFPKVDVHPAFKHLRDNNLIVKTWNFPLKKENVYGWNSHGTMTLSCISGIGSQQSLIYNEIEKKNVKLGLATGAEFLLARTEISIEPGKEEVWWMQAMEWADKNGADIISSSLGYGDARHDVSDMDGKKCLVSRAANMAAAKGMLVCNSMGNEADKKSWKTLIAPADADSVLTVGGIGYNDYHAYFSSYGPTADGRLKPNVCAYATQCRVANPSSNQDKQYDFASGTSFSCPLVAGFAACAWQKQRNLNAMELKREIERSADLYPYFDYAYGYGVPQASYFMFPEIKSINKTFEIEETDDFFIIKPLVLDCDNRMYYHIKNKDGSLTCYANVYFKNEDQIKNDFFSVSNPQSNVREVKISKKSLLEDKQLTVFYKGYVFTVSLSETDIAHLKTDTLKEIKPVTYTDFMWIREKSTNDNKPSTYGVNAIHYVYPYLQWGFMLPLEPMPQFIFGKTQNFTIGVAYKGNVSKWYSLGGSIAYTYNSYRINTPPIRTFAPMKIKTKEKVNINMLSMDIYQRFRLFPGEQLGFGCYIDMGVYGGWNFDNYCISITKTKTNQQDDLTIIRRKSKIKGDSYIPIPPLQWGVNIRIGYGLLAVYGRYRISDIIANDLFPRGDEKLHIYDFPKLEVGLQLTIPTSM